MRRETVIGLFPPEGKIPKQFSKGCMSRWQKITLYPHCNTGLRKCSQTHHLQRHFVMTYSDEASKIFGAQLAFGNNCMRVVLKSGGFTLFVAIMHERFSWVQSLDWLGHWGDVRDDSAEILSQSFMQETLVSSSGMGRDVHSLMLSIQRFLCRPWHHPPCCGM